VGSNVYGIAPAANLSIVKILDCNGDGTVASLAAGLLWVSQFGERPSVVNLSLGSTDGSSDIVDSIVEDLVSSQVVVVASAGNDDNEDCDTYPARLSTVVAVGATDETDYRAYFSNFGACVDIWAPGTRIVSCSGSEYQSLILSGTSQAAPAVSATLALILQRRINQSLATDVTSVVDDLYVASTPGVVSDLSDSDNNRLLFATQGVPLVAPIGGPPVFGNPNTYFTSFATAKKLHPFLILLKLLLNMAIVTIFTSCF
jgi:subtilisin family serine protease